MLKAKFADGKISRMAWRNLWRNSRRTLITGGGIGLGLAAMVFMICWSKGLTHHMIDVVTKSGLGEAQIHAEGYRDTSEPELYIADPAPLLELAAGMDHIVGAAPRVYGEGLVAVGDRSQHLRVVGIDPARERTVTDWDTKLVAGTYLSTPNGVLVGRDLADKMELELGNKLILTIANIETGDLEYRLLRVEGILLTNNPLLDKLSAIVGIDLLAGDMGVGRVGAGGERVAGAHELVFALDVDPLDEAALRGVLAPFEREGLDVSPWQEVAPVVAQMTDLQGIYIAITLGIIFFLIAFGIVNTMSMSLLERFHEFGVLRALGTRPWSLARLVLSEAAWIGAIGCFMGLALGLAAVGIIMRTGIRMGDVEAMGVTFATPVYPLVDGPAIMWSTVAFLLLTPFVAGLVAFRAARVDPVRALRAQ